MYFPPGGIADRMISFNGFPFLDTKEEHTFHVPVSSVMTPYPSITALPSTGLTLQQLEALLRQTAFQGFPIIEDPSSRLLLGYIGRTELRYAIEKTKKEHLLRPDAHCRFLASAATANRTPSSLVPPVTFDALASSSGAQTIDFARFINPTPLAVHPRLPLETVMEVFKKMGPRVVLVEFKGRLTGLVTVKDCLKYQFTAEAQERGEHGGGGGGGDSRADRVEIWLWESIRRLGWWGAAFVGRVSRGRVRLGNGEERGEGLLTTRGLLAVDADALDSPAAGSESFGRRRTGMGTGTGTAGILDGTEDGDDGVELRER